MEKLKAIIEEQKEINRIAEKLESKGIQAQRIKDLYKKIKKEEIKKIIKKEEEE